MTTFLINIDDIVLVGDLVEIQCITSCFDATFKIKYLRNLRFYIGIEVAHIEDSSDLCQHKYTPDLLFDNGMLASCPISSTPLNYNTCLHFTSSELLQYTSTYRWLIDRLLHLTHTRLNITYIQHLSQFMSSPIQDHYKVVFRILCYLKSTPGVGTFLYANSTLQPKAFNYIWIGFGVLIIVDLSLTFFFIYFGSSLISYHYSIQEFLKS